MQVLHLGKEIYNFFGIYGLNGILGIIISSWILGILINKIVSIINKEKIENYNEFIEFIFRNKKYKDKLSDIINIVVNCFLIASFFIMMAGLSAYFFQKYNIKPCITSTIGAVFCYLVLIKNIDGIVKLSTICVPVIIFYIIIVGLKNFNTQIPQNYFFKFYNNLILKSFVSSLLYAGYNSILLIPVIISLKNQTTNINNSKKKMKFNIGKIVTVILSLLGILVLIILANEEKSVMYLDMPLAFIIKKYGKIYEYLYGIVIVTAITTSIISAGFGFLNNITKNKKTYKIFLKIICITSVFISNLGFSNLINLLYPIFGILGFIQILIIFTKTIEKNQ